MALVPSNEFNRLKDGARRFASGFTRGQKAATILSLIGLVVVGAFYMSLSSKPTYSILFTNLKSTDAASITQELASNHVPYQLQDGGTTILVPQNDVDQQRLVAAQAGLPSQSTSGLSVLDKEGLTTSQLTQQADYLQAIQGELEQTIDSINGVASSDVNVAMPANQTFALGATNPTGASVLVDLESGQTLSPEEVQAVSSLVASAVPGLSASEVTVADSSGDLLAGPGVSNDGQNSSSETAYDTAEQAKVVAYLTSVLGAGNADVQVNAQLNFDQVKTQTQTLVNGQNGKPVSACTNTDTSSTKYTGAGAGSSISSVAAASTGNGSYTQTSSQTTCQTGTEDQTVVQAPGGVMKQSVAVVVNSRALPKGLQLAELQRGVAAAAGIETGRGDVLSFSAAPFAVSPPAAAAAKKSMLTSMAKPGLAGLLAIVMLLMLWRTSRKAKKQTISTSQLVDGFGYDPFALGAGMDPVTAELPAVHVSGPNPALSVHEIVEAQPEEVATVLRDWLQHSNS